MKLNAILVAVAALLCGTGLCAGETLEYHVTGVFPGFMSKTQYTALNEQPGWSGDHLFARDLNDPVMDVGRFQVADATILTVTPTPEPAVTAVCAVIVIGLLIARRRMRTINLRKSYGGGSRGPYPSNRPPR